MNVIAAYVVAKENLNRKIAEKTADFYLTGMSYEEALEKAKKAYADCKDEEILNKGIGDEHI